MKRFFGLITAAAIAFSGITAITPSVLAQEENPTEEFETVSDWKAGSGSSYISVCTDGQYVKSGSASAAMQFKSSDTSYEYEFANKNWSQGGWNVVRDQKIADSVSFWIYGCNDDSLSLYFNYKDSAGKSLRTKSLYMNFDGWKYVTLDMFDVNYIYSIVLKSPKATEAKTIYMDALKVDNKENPGFAATAPDQPQTMQLDNSNPLQQMEISGGGDSGSGVTYMNSQEVIFYDKNTIWKMYSPQLAIDGDPSTCYSSGLYYGNSTPENEWIQVQLPSLTTIRKVALTTKLYGSNFPIDFDIQTSLTGRTWTTVKNVRGVSTARQEVLTYTLSQDTQARFVRIVSKTLKPQSESTYYAQIAEIAVYDTNSNNVALYENGARATARNPLNGDEFDYETFYDDTFLTGVKWVNITNEFAYNTVKSGNSTSPSATEIKNFKKISDKGIQILYRFTNAPSWDEINADPDAAADRYIQAIESRVEALKNYVSVWGIFGEINSADNSRAEKYAYVIKKVAERIKSIDPDAKINIATALIDFGWTDKMLDAGLKDVVDIIGVHIYKETGIDYSMPEASGRFMKNGVDTVDSLSPYLDYTEEMTAYRALVDSYSTDIQIMVTEVSEPLEYTEENNIIQAKWLTRQYGIDKKLGVDGTFWFTVDSISAPKVISTLVWTDGSRTPAWYALQRYNSVFQNNVTKAEVQPTVSGNTSKLMYEVYENDEEYLIPYWYATPFRGSFNGSTIDIDFAAMDAGAVTAVDLLTGAEQEINLTGTAAKNLIARDYVSVLKVKKTHQQELWNPMENRDFIWATADNAIEISTNTNPQYIKGGSGSVKVASTAVSGSAYIRNSKPITFKENETPVKLSVWVYGVNASGSTLCIYGRDKNGKEINWDSAKIHYTLQNGWQKLNFEITGFNTIDMLIWENRGENAVLYLDNMDLTYQKAENVLDSFETYTEDWLEVGYSLSENSDLQFVKDGSKSLRVDCVDGKEAYVLRSRYMYCGGRKIPEFEGYTPKTFGFWIYNDGANIQLKPEGSNDWKSVSQNGWTYLSWELPQDGNTYAWTKDHLNQLVMRCSKSGVIYIDALKIGYQSDAEDDTLQIGELTLSSEGRELKNLSGLKTGNVVEGSVQIQKQAIRKCSMDMLLAVYDRSGALSEVQIETITLEPEYNGSFTKTIRHTLEHDAEQIKQIKGFVWNDSDNICSLTPAITLQ